MSYWPDDLTAIQYAVGRGVIVVEAAGNGAQHLDDAVYGGPGPGFRPHRPNPFAARRARLGLDPRRRGRRRPAAGAAPTARGCAFSNWGSALDAQGWGRDVATTGGARRRAPTTPRPGADEDAWYTDRLRAAPRAPRRWSRARSRACRACCAPRAARRSTPAQARTALRETGSPSRPAADGSLQRIGNRPDIAQLIDWAMEATRPARPTTPRPRRTAR